MSKDLDTYLSRLPQRVTDNIFLIWRSKYQQDDNLLSMEDLENSLILNPAGLPSRQSETARFSSPLIYNQVMRECILCTHKSLAILRSIVRDLSSGQQTYSDVSAYLANMLMGRAICLFLGIWFSPCKVNNDYYLIDLFILKTIFHFPNNYLAFLLYPILIFYLILLPILIYKRLVYYHPMKILT